MSTSFDRAHPTTSIARGARFGRAAKLRSAASLMGARMVRERGMLFLGGVVAFASIEMIVLNHVASTSPADDKNAPLATSHVETHVGAATVATTVVRPRSIVSHPVVARPIVTQPIVTQPVAMQPVVTHPVAAHVVAMHPVVADRAVAHQLASRPVVAALAFRPLDDSGDGAGLGSFAYAGSWEHVHGIADGRSEGTSTRSYHAGATATLRFAGREVKLVGITGPTGGRAIVQVDGRVGPTVEFYAPTKHVAAVVYASPLLTRGDHTLSIEIVAANAGSSKRKYINIDGALAAP